MWQVCGEVVDDSELIEYHLEGIETQSAGNKIRSKIEVNSQGFIFHPDCVRHWQELLAGSWRKLSNQVSK